MSSQEEYSARLAEKLLDSVEDNARQWLEDSLERMANSDAPENDLLVLSAMARRKLGDSPLSKSAESIETPHGSLEVGYWGKGDAGRMLILLRLTESQPQQPTRWVRTLFRYGDELERSAVVRALVLFPDPGTLKSIALEAGRCNSLMLYSALALKNPYPAAFYEEPEYNQVVLKSLFTGLNISLVAGLERRANRDLSRMCEDYVDERLAAGRTVPSEIWLAIAPHASDHGKELMLRYLNDRDAAHRYYAALAMTRHLSGDDEVKPALAERLNIEPETHICTILEKGLAG